MATTPVQPAQANTHYSAQFGKLLEPGLRKIFFETYAEVPEQFSKVLKVNKSTKYQEVDWGMGAFGDWEQRADEFDTVAYAKLSPGLERTYVHRAFTKGFMLTRELVDDEQYNQINKFPKAMARSGRAFVEKEASTVFRNAFSAASPIYDGKPLLANNHPLLDSAALGNNLVTGALTDANLKLALQCMREQVDEAGNLIGSTPKMLIVPPSLEYAAKEIVNSALKSGTALNDINTVKGALEVFVYDYIGSASGGNDNAWYLLDPTLADLNFFWRIKPEFKWAEDFDTFIAKYRGYMRFSYGVSDWRGICGSQGSAAVVAPEVYAGTVTRASDIAATIGFTTTEGGTAYYLVLAAGATTPSGTEVAAGTSLGTVTAGAVTGQDVTLTAGAKDIYVVVKDSDNNISVPLRIPVAAYTG